MSKISNFWKNREGYTYTDAAYIILDMSPQPPEHNHPLEVIRIIDDLKQTLQKYKPDDFKLIEAGERGISKLFVMAFAENYGITDFFKDDPLREKALELLGNDSPAKVRIAKENYSDIKPEATLNDREYRHTGWRIIDDQYHYLTSNGAINADTLDESIRVELDPGHMQRYQLPAPGDRTKHSARLLLELLEIAPKNLAVGAALVCAVCRAPLAEAALIDFSIFFAGQSGSYKSEIAALAMGFFGNFCGRSFPSNFKDTVPLGGTLSTTT